MKRRVISLLLAMLLVFGSFPLTASAATDLEKPQISSVTNGGVDSGITIKWTDSNSSTKFAVQRKSSSDSSWKTLTSTATTKTYTDKTATVGGEKYYYRVRAYSGGAWGSWSTAVNIIRNPFTDISTSASYFKALMWAYNKGIIAGTSNTAFSPNANCTRGQFALMLWRMNGKPSIEGMSNPFKDVKSSNGFYKGIVWCYNKGITAGTTATTFSPNNNITRWQLILMLWRMRGKPEPKLTYNPFSDVKTSASYYKAALWAYENGITAVTSFKPNDLCTRWQLVFFLYRLNNPTGTKWPAGVVTLLSGFQAGSLTDNNIQTIKDWIVSETGAKVEVTNDDVGGGADLAVQLSQAAGDGQTLMLFSLSSLTNYLQGVWTIDPTDATLFKPVCGIAQPNPYSGCVLLTNSDNPYSTWAELENYIKANPGCVSVMDIKGKIMDSKTKSLFYQRGLENDVIWSATDSRACIPDLLSNWINIVMLDENTAAALLADAETSAKVKAIINCRPDNDFSYYTEETSPNLDLLKTIPTLEDVFGKELAQQYNLTNFSFFAVPASTPDSVVAQIKACIDKIDDEPVGSDFYNRCTANTGSKYYSKDWTPESLMKEWQACMQKLRLFIK